MIFIVVKFTVRPEQADGWLDLVADFTAAVRAEPGNLFFDWARSVDDPNQFWLTEGFVDDAAGQCARAVRALQAPPSRSCRVPSPPRRKIVSTTVDQDGWGEMGEVSPR